MAPTGISKLTVRIARWSAHHPWRSITMWIVAVALAVLAGTQIPTVSTTDADYRTGESGRASAMIADAGLEAPPGESVLITSSGSRLDRAEADRAARDVVRRMSALADVTGVAQPVWSADRSALLVNVELKDGVDDVSALQKQTREVAAAHDGLRVEQVGVASVNDAVNDRVSEDLGRAEKLSLPITLALMLLAFGAFLAAGIPVLLAITAVAATMGLYAPMSHLVPSEPTVGTMIVLIGMAVGVDYSLFFLKREREEHARGRDRSAAIDIAAATSGHSILVSGGAVIVCMAGLYAVRDVTFNALATASIMVVAVSVIGSITVLPALLGGFGRFVDKPRVPLVWRLSRRMGRGALSRRIMGPVVRHPVVSLGVSAVALGALAVPGLHLKLDETGLSTMPSSIPEVSTMMRVQEAFPTEGTAHEVVVRGDDRAQVTSVLREVSDRATSELGLARSDRVAVSADGRTGVLTLASPAVYGSERSKDDLRELRTLAHAVAGPQVHQVAVGGDSAMSVDATRKLSDALPWVVGIVLALTLVLMGVAFRSVPIALVTLVLNLASVGAAFGVLGLVFEHQWAEGILGFESTGFVVDWMPLMLFVVLVGLSMDYHVFVLSRVRERARRGVAPRQAVASGIAETAGVVTSAAAVMISVFSLFATLSLLEMKQLGVGLAVAILIDATIVRTVMLPAVLVLLGDRAWWPSRGSAATAGSAVLAGREDEPVLAR